MQESAIDKPDSAFQDATEEKKTKKALREPPDPCSPPRTSANPLAEWADRLSALTSGTVFRIHGCWMERL